MDYQHNDGPWDLEEGFRKINGLLKYTHGDQRQPASASRPWATTASGSRRTRSRCAPCKSGEIDRFGLIDPTDGGETHRYSLSADYWTRAGARPAAARSPTAVDYKLDLISNFTYYHADPDDGDQFEQFDDRNILGGNLRYTMPLALGGSKPSSQSGIDIRHDDISPVGLYHTRQRVRLADHSRRRSEADQLLRVHQRRHRVDAEVPHDARPARRLLRLRREQQPRLEQRHGQRFHRRAPSSRWCSARGMAPSCS